MCKITIVDNSACFVGTCDSILIDSNCLPTSREVIMAEVYSKTSGNTTYIFSDEVPSLVKHVFKEYLSLKIDEPTDFDTVPNINNKTSFGILFWKGDGKGNNQHATRLVSTATMKSE
jgi:hypothetical protein